jgi:hypothetical protein
MTVVAQFTPQTLKNRGVPVQVHELTPPLSAGAPWTRTFDANDEPVLTQLWLQLTNSILADVEDDLLGWGSLDEWQKAMQAKPFQTIARTLALAFGWVDAAGRPDYRRAGLATIDGEAMGYSVAISSAFAIANGADPTKTSEQLLKQLARAAATRAEQEARMDEALAADEPVLDTPTPLPSGDTPGSSGSKPGADLTDLSKSSGV